MEQFKALCDVTVPDERHFLLGAITGTSPSLEGLHRALGQLTLSRTTPEELRGQFNVARNLAIYSWYSYSLDPVAQLQSYILIEYALDIRNGRKKSELKKLLKKAVSQRWIIDAGFRHVKLTPDDEQAYCKTLVEVLPKLRNAAAHGSDDLTSSAVQSLAICADFINQLFPDDVGNSAA